MRGNRRAGRCAVGYLAAMLLLLACAEPATDSVTTAGLVSVAASVPYVPDLGSLRDPRVAGCSPGMVSHDGTWARYWRYDAQHVLAEAHHTATYTVGSDGSVGTVGDTEGAATFTAGDSLVPIAGAYVDGDAAPIDVAFDLGCD